jgi:pyrroline-5-carboxylate reductase
VKYRLGIVGAGKMGEAILAGALKNGLYAPGEIILSVRSESHRQELERKYGVAATLDNRAIAAESPVILLAIKPKTIASVLDQMGPDLAPGSLVISTAAGVPIGMLESHLPPSVGVVRAMPNMAVAVGEGMTALSRGGKVPDEGMRLAERLFGSVGAVVTLDESLMDAVTGLSGAGPAYIYLVIESLADGGVKMGLPRDIAIRLAAQTTLGAAKAVLVTGEHPAKLKDQVATPAGATIEGILELEEGGVRAALIKSVVKATERSRQLLSK